MFTVRSMYSASAAPDFALDLGTSKIALYAKGEGIVSEEAACIAFVRNRKGFKSVVAFGHKAVKMIGKVPTGVSVLSPIQNGVVTDSATAALIVKAILNNLKLTKYFQRKKILMGYLFGANSMELKAFMEVGRIAGARSCIMIAEPLAAAIGVGLPVESSKGHMVVDIGGGATEAVVTSCCKVVAGGSVRVGGDAMNEAISNYVLRQYGLKIATMEAQRLREFVATTVEDLNIAVRGVDIRLKRPAEIRLSILELIGSLMPSFVLIKTMIIDLIASLPVELAADLWETGIVLTGGGSIHKTLQTYLAEATQIPVKVHHASRHAVILGAGQLMHQFTSKDRNLCLNY